MFIRRRSHLLRYALAFGLVAAIAAVAAPAANAQELPSSEEVQNLARDAAKGLVNNDPKYEKLGKEGQQTKEDMGEWLVFLPRYDGGKISNLVHLSQLIAITGIGVLTTFLAFYGLIDAWGGRGDMIAIASRIPGALFFIAAWPWLAKQVIILADSAADAMLGDTAWVDLLVPPAGIGDLLGSVLGVILAIIFVVAFAFGMIGVFLVKIGMEGGIAVAFVGMPVAVFIWLLPPWKGPAEQLGAVFMGCVTTHLGWAVIITSIEALRVDQFHEGSWAEGLQAGFYPFVVLILMLSTTKRLIVWFGGSSAGGGRGIMALAAGFFGLHAAQRHLPSWAGGMSDVIAQQKADRIIGSERNLARDLQNEAASFERMNNKFEQGMRRSDDRTRRAAQDADKAFRQIERDGETRAHRETMQNQGQEKVQQGWDRLDETREHHSQQRAETERHNERMEDLAAEGLDRHPTPSNYTPDMAIHGTDATGRPLDGDPRGIDYSNPVQSELNRSRMVVEERGGSTPEYGRMAWDELRNEPGYRDRIERVAWNDTYSDQEKERHLATMSVEASGNGPVQSALRELTVNARQGQLREFVPNPALRQEAPK